MEVHTHGEQKSLATIHIPKELADGKDNFEFLFRAYSFNVGGIGMALGVRQVPTLYG